MTPYMDMKLTAEGAERGRLDAQAKLDTAQSELAALREELAKYKTGCVDLSSQVRELEHKMDYWKGEGKRADDAHQRLTAAEQRNAELVDLLREVVEKQSYELEHRGARYRSRWGETLQKLKSTTEKLSGAESHE